MKGTKTYVYGLLNSNDSICYIGKSSRPRERLYRHKIEKGWVKCKILDIFYDTENYWVRKFKSEGCILENKFDIIDEEEWQIDDIISIENLKTIKIENIENGKIYNSLSELSDELGIERNALHYILKNPNHKNRKKYPYVII